ncbi:MAG TPA: methylated-DNA--[protein]-cysteine S-methyltransferase [Candidatus Baltobacteraceae bacterium]|nr:methylated-DNA--[protein]-cysteine S-methyltransferase [Candidatus Baltobacteraceae bacterium]
MPLILPTPFGAPLLIEADAEAIVTCDFRPRARTSAGRPAHPVLREASVQLRAYFAKRLRRFDLPLALHGTPLQVAVWQFVSQLETGELISYGDVARAIGSPGAHRGVAAAMGRSPYDLLIPAHRVIGADGKIKGAGPRSIRRLLLAFEGITL